jgi:peptide/nickel transport system permease protein
MSLEGVRSPTDVAENRTIAEIDLAVSDEVERAPRPAPGGGARTFWRRFAKNRLAVVGLVFIVILVLTAIFADVIAPFAYDERTPDLRQPPSRDHWFGTDTLGYDVFSRVVYGARVSLRIGTLATLMLVIIGVTWGALSGFFGGAIDSLMMRFVDVFLSIPYIILAVAIATVFGRSENAIIIVLGATAWLSLARVVRSSFLGLTKLEYAEAARALGFGRMRRVFGHLLPNALVPIIVFGTIAIGGVILSEAALSFVGVGPQFPTPAWGLMVSTDKGQIASAPHIVFFPGMAIFLTVLSFVLVGDGLRDTLDPKMRR